MNGALLYVGDCRALKKVQRRWTKRVDGLREVPYNLHLAELDLFSVKGRLLRNDLKMVWKILHSLYPALEGLFQLNTSGVTRGHSFKILVPHCTTDVRSRFFSVRVYLIKLSLLVPLVFSIGSFIV